MAKFKSFHERFFECAIWPSTGGRKNLHVLAGFLKKGWMVFWEMIRDCLGKEKSFLLSSHRFGVGDSLDPTLSDDSKVDKKLQVVS